MILRISRTYPRIDQQGIGLHCFFYSKLIRKKTTIFTKKINSNPHEIPPNVTLKEIGYKDIKFSSQNENFYKLFFILISKLYGEIIFSLHILLFMFREHKDIKIIHLHSANYLFTTFFLKLIFSKPIIINLGGTDLQRIIRYKLLRNILSKFDAILFVSSDMDSVLSNYCPNVPRYKIGNGVDSNLFFPNSQNRDKLNLFAIGNFRWQKGYQYMFEALYLLKNDFPMIKLFIAGSSDEINYYKDLASKLKLNNNIIFLGSISRNEVKQYLDKSTLFISSSVSEGFPKSLIEAISCGVPVVVTNVGESQYIVDGNYGLVAESKNSNDLYLKIKKLLFNDNLLSLYRANCINSRNKFSWNNVIRIVNNCYKNFE